MANKNVNAQLACTYAAIILYDDDLEVSAENLNKLLEASGVKVEKFWPKLFADMIKETPVNKLLGLACQGGGGAAVSAGGAAASTATGEAAPAEAAKEDKDEEEQESSKSAVGLFGDNAGDSD